MQVVKNVFLWPGRSYMRKAIELPMALAIDLVWPKRRIIEVYLNIAGGYRQALHGIALLKGWLAAGLSSAIIG